jgi:hypothetical protein
MNDEDRWRDEFNQHREQEREEAEARKDADDRQSIEQQINEIPDEDFEEGSSALDA